MPIRSKTPPHDALGLADEQDAPASVSIASRPDEGGEAGTVQQLELSEIYFDRPDGLIQGFDESLVQIVSHGEGLSPRHGAIGVREVGVRLTWSL